MICPTCDGFGGHNKTREGPWVKCLNCDGTGRAPKEKFRLERPTVSDERIANLLKELHAKLVDDVKLHGDGAFVSTHEMRGTIDEEVDEMHEEVHKGDFGKLRGELLDIAVSTLWAVASLDVWEEVERS